MRLRDAQRLRVRILGDEARRVRLGEPGADEHVLDEPAQPLLRERRPNIARRCGSVYGTSSSRTRPTSSTRSISRVTSRARQVGTVTVQSSADLEAEPLEDRVAARRAAISSPISSSARSGRRRDDRRLGQLAVDVGLARPSARRRARRGAGWRAARPARRGTGRRPSPSGSSASERRPSRSELRRIPIGSKFAASSRSSSSARPPRSRASP